MLQRSASVAPEIAFELAKTDTFFKDFNMPSFAQVYAEAVHQNLPKYYSNFPPMDPVALGDYGTLENHVFRRLGNVAEFGITLTEPSASGSIGDITFQNGEGISTSIRGDGKGLEQGKAGLVVSFARKNSILFKAVGCQTSAVGSWRTFSAQILEIYEQRNGWKASWVVVTSLVSAKSLTVLAAAGDSASIELEAKAETGPLDLANAEAGLRVVKESGLAARIVAETKSRPLVGLARLRVWPLMKPVVKEQRFHSPPGHENQIERELEREREAGRPLADNCRLVEIVG